MPQSSEVQWFRLESRLADRSPEEVKDSPAPLAFFFLLSLAAVKYVCSKQSKIKTIGSQYFLKEEGKE